MGSKATLGNTNTASLISLSLAILPDRHHIVIPYFVLDLLNHHTNDNNQFVLLASAPGVSLEAPSPFRLRRLLLGRLAGGTSSDESFVDWLIKYFSTRRELLSGHYQRVGISVRDEAGLIMFIGHKYLCERGVLHRDISPGIKWQPSSEPDQPNTSGCLIDLDHAEMESTQDEVKAPAMINSVPNLIYDASDVGVEKQVARLSLDFPSESMNPQGNPSIRLRAQNHPTGAINHALHFHRSW